MKYPVRINNSIFNDLERADTKSFEKATLYSYYSLVAALYRNCVYNERLLTQNDLKEMVGYNSKNKKIDHLIKKGGVLDSLGYTISTRDIPAKWDCLHDNKILYKEKNLPKNYKIKYPVKAHYREENSEILNGSYFNYYNTHPFDAELFYNCFADENIGTIGFYYCNYIRVNMNSNNYNGIVKDLSEQLSLSRNTCIRYLSLIKKSDFFNEFDKKGTMVELNRYLRMQLDDWRKHVLKQYNNKCYITNKPGKLHVHHTIPFSEVRDNVLKITNINIKPIKNYTNDELEKLKKSVVFLHEHLVEGVPLLKEVHELFHEYYGDFGFTKRDLDEFKYRYHIGEIKLK
jgi:hypothetical protein